MDRKLAVFSAAEMLAWKESGIPEKWHPYNNLITLMTGGGSDGGGSPIRSPFVVPECAVLEIMPRGCPRHGDVVKMLSPLLRGKIWHLRLEEKDVATGQYLKEAEKAIEEVVARSNPKALFLVLTCMDLLLGSDYPSLAKKMEKKLGVRIGITQMQPVVNGKLDRDYEIIIKEIHGVLRGDKTQEKLNAVNILGREAPPNPNGDFVKILKQAGVENVYHIAQFKTLEEADIMCRSKLNIAIEYGALPAAKMMEKRWGIPYIFIENSFHPDEIRSNYKRLGEALQLQLDDATYYDEVQQKLESVLEKCKDDRVVIGEMLDKRPLRAAKEFMQLGFPVEGVFNKILLDEDYPHLEAIVSMNPDVQVYISRHPSMMKYLDEPVDYTLGFGMNPFLQKKSPVTRSVQDFERYPEYAALGKLLDDLDNLKKGVKQGPSMAEIILSGGPMAGAGRAKEPHKQMKRWEVSNREKLK